MESSNPNAPPANNSGNGPEQTVVTHPWSSGLFDCFDDVPNCCITLWFPCVTFGQIAEIVDQGASSCGVNGGMYFLIALMSIGLTGWNCACIYSCFYRTHIRVQYSLHENPLGDCMLHFLCEQCALCQEYRELKHRGFDMSLGWHGNMNRQRQPEVNNAGLAPPVVEQGMSRDK